MPARSFYRESQSQRQGYVLLVVLAASVLVITVLSTLAKVSLRRGLQAADAQRTLQQRWGALTLQRTTLRQAPKIFELLEEIAKKEDPGAPSPTKIRTAITLGDVTFDLLLADEDAKLNLNALYHHVGKLKTEQAITDIAGPGVRMSMRLQPATKPLLIERESPRLNRADDDSEEESTIPDAFRSWGEVLDLAGLQRDFRSEAALPNVTTGITCWGNGQLNFQRASDEAILAIAGSVIQDGGARRLLQSYRQSRAPSLQSAIQSEVKQQGNRDRLNRLLSGTSNNFSLWTHASTKGGQALQQFVVMSRDDEGVTRYQTFAH